MSLEAYTFSGQEIQPGDLIYTVVEGERTNVMIFTPSQDAIPRSLAVLPGAVAQISLHPDRQGMDYLAGVLTQRDSFTYFDHLALYTLRFGDSAPRLLYRFDPNLQNTVGTTVRGAWSWDGQFVVFRLASTLPGGGFWRYVWFDLSCRQTGNCIPQEIPLKPQLELYQVVFAPNDYRLLFTGSDYSATGKTDIFLLDFDPAHPERQPVNLTTNYSVGDGLNHAVWNNSGEVFTVCTTMADAEPTDFCLLDPQTSALNFQDQLQLPQGWRLFGGYWISPAGDYLAALLFPKNAPKSSTLGELRLYDIHGKELAILATTRQVNEMAFSKIAAQVAYIFDDGQMFEAYDISTGKRWQLYSSTAPNSLSWLEWVH